MKLKISILIILLVFVISAKDFDFSDFNNYGFLPEKPMTLIIPMYNNHDWVAFCLDSVFTQRYSNYSAIIIDDASSDDTTDLIYELIKKYNKESCVKVITNTQRKGALYNIYHAIWDCPDTDIIVTIDGDDSLFDEFVLKKVNSVYTWSDIWLTHGYFLEYPSLTNFWSDRIPQKIIRKNRHRKHTPHPSHLRTFYAKLFKLIAQNDLMYQGNFFQMTWDQAMIFPMIEMAAERHYYFDWKNILYLYNRATPINDNKVNPHLQLDLEKVIRARPKYHRIPSLWDYENTAYLEQKRERELNNETMVQN